jgi:DNA-binding transcriptional LysR family regulator
MAVYDELSLTAAAKRCFVAQPSISSAIQELESELNCQLFIRHTKGVTPTQAGNNLYPYASKVVGDVQAIKAYFKQPMAKVCLKLALMPFLSRQRVSLIIKDLLATVQGLDLTLVDLSEEADARIISSGLLDEHEAFHKLWHDEYVLATPAGHPLSTLKAVPMKMLDGIPFISRQPCDVMAAWTYAVQKSGVMVDIKAVVKTEEYALDLVAAGLGISLVPSHSTGFRQDIVTCKISDLKLERIVGLAYHRDHPLPAQLVSAIENAKEPQLR